MAIYQVIGNEESNTSHGPIYLFFLGLSLLICQIVEVIYLKLDGQYQLLYIMISIWIFTRCIVFIGMLIKDYKLEQQSSGSSENTDTICEKITLKLLMIIFSIFYIDVAISEYYIKKCSKSDQQLFKNQIYNYSVIINSLPLNIINIYLISDTTIDLDSHIYFYFAMLLIKQIQIGYMIVSSVHNDQYNNKYGSYQLLSSVFINLCYWYLLIQSFMFSWIIGVCILILNLTACVFDSVYFKEYSLQDKYFTSFFKIFQYLFCFNVFTFTNISSQSSNLELKKSSEILPISIQCLTVVLLFSVKLVYYPLITYIDIVFYVLLGLALPLIYLVFVNFYYSLIKQNHINLQLKYSGNTIQIKKKAYELLSDRFVFSYKAEMEFDSKQLISGDKLSFEKSLQNINQFRIALFNSKPDDSQLKIKDTNQQIELNLQPSQTNDKSQFIYIRKEFFENEQREYILNRFCQFLLQYELIIYFEFDNECKVQDIQRFMIQISSFETHKIQLINYQNEKFREIFENIIFQIRSNHYFSLAFSKHISNQLYQNPQVILYDLFEDFL